MQPIIERLNSGEMILLVGSGVSAELGLPTWPTLCQEVKARIPPGVPGQDEADRLLSKNRFAEFMGWVERSIGREALLDTLKELLADPGKIGQISSLLVKLPFKQILTTNYDNTLARHFAAAGVFVPTITNTKDALSSIDWDVTFSVVKLHSDLDHPDSLIVTAEEYGRAAHAGEWQYFRDFLLSLFTRSVLIVGYSVTDPDVTSIFAHLRQNLARQHSIYAIIADAQPEDIRRFSDQFNIEVQTYASDSGDHSQLYHLLRSLEPFVSPPSRPQPNPEINLKRAQALYLWSKLGLSRAAHPIQIDALKSLLLYILVDAPRTVEDLSNSAGHFVGLAGEAVKAAVGAALGGMEAAGYVSVEGSRLALTTAGHAEVSAAASQHQQLRESFIEQAKLDLTRTVPTADSQEISSAAETVLEAVVDVFQERGIEIIQALNGQPDPRLKQSANLFATISRACAGLSPELRAPVLRYVVDILTAPGRNQRVYLEHLARAFFSFEALAMDPDGHRFREEFLGDITLILDSNMLIPVLAGSSMDHGAKARMIDQAHRAGIRLATTAGFVFEAWDHGRWARSLVNLHGERSLEVEQAALGRGFRRNAFLDGFVNFSVATASVSFATYLDSCTGARGGFSEDGIRAYLEDECGIAFIDFNEVGLAQPESYTIRTDLEEFSADEAARRGIRKGQARIEAEAEAYAIIEAWTGYAEAKTLPAGSRAHLLSDGGFLNRMAKWGPYPANHPVVVHPDVLYGFLLQTGPPPEMGFSFRELILSPLFDMSTHFVERRNYELFFEGIIRDAERFLTEHTADLAERLNQALTPNFFDETPRLDRPFLARQADSLLKFSFDDAKREMLSEATRLAEVRLKSTQDAAAAAALLEETQRAVQKAQKQLGNIDAATARKARKARQRAAQKNKRRP